jgi:F-type H+-transporting ATPase subunit a
MPEHTSFFSYLIALFPALGQNMHVFGEVASSAIAGHAHGAEPLAASLFVMLLIVVPRLHRPRAARRLATIRLSFPSQADAAHLLRGVRRLLVRADEGHDGAARAKRYFPLIGTLSLFIVFSNAWVSSRASRRPRPTGTSLWAARSSSS